jgi:hypothetical protein
MDKDISTPFGRLTEVSACGKRCVDDEGDFEMLGMRNGGKFFEIRNREHWVSERFHEDELGFVVH